MTQPVEVANQLAPAGSAPALAPVAGVLGGLTDTGTQLAAAGVWLANRHNWTRIGWFAAGYVLFLVGAYLVAKPVATPVVQGTTKAAASAAKLVI